MATLEQIRQRPFVERAQTDLAGQPGITESLKPGYRIIQVTDPAAQVELYLPSQQLTTTLMGL